MARTAERCPSGPRVRIPMPVCGAICLVCIVIKLIEYVRRPVSEFVPTSAASPLE